MIFISKTDFSVFILVSLLSVISIADDNVRFRSKSYSGKSADNKNYRAKSYRTEKKTLRHKNFTGSTKKSGKFWNIFKRKKKSSFETLPEQSSKSSKKYQKNDKLVIKSESLRSKELSGQDKLRESETPANKTYKPENKKRGRNPLLAPRQGIKAPVIKKED